MYLDYGEDSLDFFARSFRSFACAASTSTNETNALNDPDL